MLMKIICDYRPHQGRESEDNKTGGIFSTTSDAVSTVCGNKNLTRTISTIPTGGLISCLIALNVHVEQYICYLTTSIAFYMQRLKLRSSHNKKNTGGTEEARGLNAS